MCDVSPGRDPREDLADSLRGRGSPGDWDNHRRKQSDGKAGAVVCTQVHDVSSLNSASL